MAPDSDKNWWTFSIDPAVRSNRERSRFTGDMDINPEVSAGRRDLDYRHYLGLERLLSSQVPSSRIPDERVFIVTHQLMEIVFKLAIFDMAVVAQTLESFAGSGAEPESLLRHPESDEFWRPAMTASARLAFACRELLPAAMRLLSDPKDADETFNSIEFYRFRENLEPASGFQSAQFRLMQRGLGKSNLLSVRLFPSQTYQQYYGDKTDATVRVVDRVILRQDAAVASPPGNSPLDQAARLDDAAHAALARLAPTHASAAPPEKIEQQQIDRAADLLDRILAGREKNGAPAASTASSPFRDDLVAAAASENERRDRLAAGRAGSQWLRRSAPASALHRIVTRIAAADDALHGTGQDSFLSVHMRVTRERLHQIKAFVAKTGGPEPTAGTGGGGLEYLGWAQRYLIPLFPALVAYRELGD